MKCKEKKMEKGKGISELQDYFKGHNIHVIGVPQIVQVQKRRIYRQNFSKFDEKLQNHRSLNKLEAQETKKTIPKHIITILLKINEEETNHFKNQGKKTHYTQKNKDKGGCKFSSEAMQMRRHWNKMN